MTSCDNASVLTVYLVSLYIQFPKRGWVHMAKINALKPSFTMRVNKIHYHQKFKFIQPSSQVIPWRRDIINYVMEGSWKKFKWLIRTLAGIWIGTAICTHELNLFTKIQDFITSWPLCVSLSLVVGRKPSWLGFDLFMITNLCLTHRDRVTHICVRKYGHYWFR